MFGWFKSRRRKQLLAEVTPLGWVDILRQNVEHYTLLATDQQERLKRLTQVLVAERSWEGCNGISVTDEIKVTIAGQAAVMLLGMEEPYFFDRVTSILIYPDMIERKRTHKDGFIHTESSQTLLGEAWQNGGILLSWPDVLDGTKNPCPAGNVVIHELAHHLDSLDGEMAGVPPLGSKVLESRWKAVFQQEFDELNRQLRAGEPTFLDSYAATSMAEMFAVTSECFFQCPGELAEFQADLFQLLQQFYQQDPRLWLGRRENR